MGLYRFSPVVPVPQATYGDGEPTDTSAAFYKALTDAAEAAEAADGAAAAPLAGLSTAVFGLGNRQYEHFNSAGKGVNRALKALGAKIILPIGARSLACALARPRPLFPSAPATRSQPLSAAILTIRPIPHAGVS